MSVPRSNLSSRSGSIVRSSSHNAGPVVVAAHGSDVRSQVYDTLAHVGVPEKICQFFADVLQTEYDMNVTVDRLLQRLKNFDGRPLDPEAAFKVTQELTKNFHTWKNSLDGLAAQGRELPMMTVDAETMNDSMVALCGYESQQMMMSPGDEMQIVDSSQPGKILVRSNTGQQGYIPALCCLLPSPDYTPRATIRRLKVQLLAQWTESVKAIQVQLSHCLSSTVSSLTKHWRTQCAHSCGMSKDRVSRRLKRVTDILNKAKGSTHSSSLDYTRLHSSLFSLEKELLSLEQKTEVMKMVDTVANLDRAILCYQMLHKQWQQHREALAHEKQPIRVMEHWPARPGKNIKYYEYKVTMENVSTREEVTLVKPDEVKDKTDATKRIEKWVVETTEATTNETNTTAASPMAHRKNISRTTEGKAEVPLTHGDVLKPVGHIYGASCSENQAKQHMIDQWVSATVSEVEPNQLPADSPTRNGHSNDANITTEVTEEWSETNRNAGNDAVNSKGETVTSLPIPPVVAEHTTATPNSTEAMRGPPDKPWVTDEWTEERKIQYEKEIQQAARPVLDDTTVMENTTLAKSAPPKEIQQDASPVHEESTVTENTTLAKSAPPKEIQRDAIPVQEDMTATENTNQANSAPPEGEQWITEEWTEERKIPFEKEIQQDASPVQEDMTVTENANQAKSAPPEEEKWVTDEWTEERKIQYTKEISNDISNSRETQTSAEKQRVQDIRPAKYEASRKGSIQSATIKEVQPLSCQSDSGLQVVRRLSEVKHITQFVKTEDPAVRHDAITQQRQFAGAGLEGEESIEAVESVQTMTEQDAAGVREEEREWSVTTGCTETVFTDQITSALGEEVRRFVIKAVVEPKTGNDISVEEAHLKGIIRDDEGVYYDDGTDVKIPIQEAMNKQLIKVELETAKRAKEDVSAVGMVTIKYSVDPMINQVIDEATDEHLTCEEAQLKGILDQKCEIYTMKRTRERVTIDQAIENGWVLVTPGEFNVHTYAVTAVMDQKTQRKVPFAEAVEKDLFDRKTGHYVNNVSGERIYVADAISRGFLQARLVDNSQPLDIEAENKMIVDRMETMKSTVLEKIGQLTDSLDHLQ